MRLRMLISHSLLASAAPALPASWLRRAKAPSILPITLVERAFGDRRVAAKADELLAVLLELLEQVGLEVGARADVHDLEDRRQRVVVVDRRVALDQLAEAVEQVLEPQHRADALVERIFVEDQGGGDGKRAEARRPPGNAVARIVPQRSGAAPIRFQARRSTVPPRAVDLVRERDEAMPSLWMTASAAARRAARGSPAGRSPTAHRRAPVQPERATTRSSCVASAQSTTQTRSTRAAPAARFDEQRHVEHQRGRRGRRAAAARSTSTPISGCRIASRRAVAPRRRRRRASRMRGAVEAAVGGDEVGAEASRRSAAIAAPPGEVSWRAIASVSIERRAEAGEHRARPCSCRCRCRRSGRSAGAAWHARRRGRAQAQPSQPQDALARRRTARPGRRRRGMGRRARSGPRAAWPRHLHGDADDRADHRRRQDDRQQHLPAEPGAERGEQLEVAVAHAFLAA